MNAAPDQQFSDTDSKSVTSASAFRPLQIVIVNPLVSVSKTLSRRGFVKAALRALRIAGRLGPTETHHLIGRLLEVGTDFPVDPIAARQWFKKAADAGHVPSMLRLARLCLLQHPGFSWDGSPSKSSHQPALPFLADPQMARAYAIKAAETGNVEGLNLAGYLHATGQGGAVDIASALKYYGTAVEAGHPDSCVGLGTLFLTGKAGKTDFASARGCFRIAASSGNSSARYSLALMLLNGLGGPEEESEAIGLFAAAARKGHVASMRQLAKWHLAPGRSENQRKAGVAWLKKLANQNDLPACLDLINRYRTGIDTAVSLADAMKWLQKAADLGDTQAKFELAQAHANGDFAGANLADAMTLFEAAALAGHPMAQWHLDRLRTSPSARVLSAKGMFADLEASHGWNAFAAE